MKTLTISDRVLRMEEPMSYTDVLQYCCTAISHVAANVMKKAAENETQEVLNQLEQHMFDMTNIACSNLLDITFPNLSLHPDVTEEAIKKAEDEIAKERASMQDFIDNLLPPKESTTNEEETK